MNHGLSFGDQKVEILDVSVVWAGGSTRIVASPNGKKITPYMAARPETGPCASPGPQLLRSMSMKQKTDMAGPEAEKTTPRTKGTLELSTVMTNPIDVRTLPLAMILSM